MSIEKFRSLHYQGKPLLIANTWDAISSKAAEKAGFEVIGTSSHAIANMLGYEDGEIIPFEEMFGIIQKIVKSTSLLVSADIESGYTDNPELLNRYMEQLADAGVLGVNLEDGLTNGSERKLGDVSVLAAKIKSVKSHLKSKGKDIFINARIDTYTTKHPDAIEETLKRIKVYEDAGADGFFVPLINEDADIKAVLNATSLPLNVFLKAGLKTYGAFAALGVHRISYGNGIHAKITKATDEAFQKLNDSKAL